MTVFVAAASEHGATAEIAAWIGAGLAANGVDVDVRRVDAVDDVARYDAFVLGSAVYLGQWLKTARRFVDDHAGDLAGRPDLAVQQRTDRRRPAAARRPGCDAGRAGGEVGRDDPRARPQALRRQAREGTSDLVREDRRALCACERGRPPR